MRGNSDQAQIIQFPPAKLGAHFFRVLLLRAAPNRYSTEWSGRPDLLGGGDPRLFSGHAGCGVVAVSTKLGPLLSRSYNAAR
jgi:hypothetical protein